MGSFSIWHWLIVLLIVVMVFGIKKPPAGQVSNAANAEKTTIDVEAKTKS